MDTALTQKFPFILDRNLAKANCTGKQVCTSCDTVVLGFCIKLKFYFTWFVFKYLRMFYFYFVTVVFQINVKEANLKSLTK